MSPLAELPGLPTLVFLGALVLTIALVLLRTQRYYARTNTARPSLAPPERMATSPPGPTLGAPAPIVNWEVEMHDMARQLAAQLDSKIRVLEHLIHEADRAAARLEAALAAGPSGASPPETKEPPPHPSPPVDRPIGPPVSQAEALKAASAADRASPTPREAEAFVGARSRADKRYEPIYTLADYGYDAAEIARRTGTPVGEVQLILSLRSARE
jgi:hypothetical protein